MGLTHRKSHLHFMNKDKNEFRACYGNRSNLRRGRKYLLGKNKQNQLYLLMGK